MAHFTLPYFGQMNSDALEERYDAEATLAGNILGIDLNFDKEAADADLMEGVKKFLEEIEQHLPRTKEYIINDYQNEEAEDSVRFYLQFHKEEMGQEELCKQLNIDTGAAAADLDQQLIARLKVVRIGIYPLEENYFAIFDYSFGKEFTNYVLVVSTDENGQFIDMTVES